MGDSNTNRYTVHDAGRVPISQPTMGKVSVRLSFQRLSAWCEEIVRAISRSLQIFDAVGVAICSHDREYVVTFSTLERFPHILAHIDWSCHIVSVIRDSHRFRASGIGNGVGTSADINMEVPESPSRPREGLGRPFSAIPGDKTKGAKRLRPGRWEGHGRPATAFPSDKYHGNQRLRPTLIEGSGRPVTGSGRESPTGVAGLTVAETVRPPQSPSPPVGRAGQEHESSDSDRPVYRHHKQWNGRITVSENGQEEEHPIRQYTGESEVETRAASAGAVHGTGRRGRESGSGNGSRNGAARPSTAAASSSSSSSKGNNWNPRTFGLGPL